MPSAHPSLHRIDPRQTGVLLALFAATGFACKAIFAKLAYPYGVDAITLVTLRLLVSLPLLMLIRFWRPKSEENPLERQDWLHLIGLGLIGYYLSSVLDFIGLETVSASLERLILCLYPTLTILIAAAFFGKALTRRVIMAMALTYAGLFIVLLPELHNAKADWRGIGFVVASTISYALYLSLGGQIIRRIGSMRFTEMALTVSALAMLVHFLLTRPLHLLAQPLPVWWLAVLMAVFSTVLPIYSVNAAISRIGAGPTALIGSLGPVLSIAMSTGLLGEHLSLLQWLGAATVLWGVWLVGRKQ